MDVYSNIEARSLNHCFCGNAMSVTHSDCVCYLAIQQFKEHAPYYIANLAAFDPTNHIIP
jgi:hypothetical protein